MAKSISVNEGKGRRRFRGRGSGGLGGGLFFFLWEKRLGTLWHPTEQKRGDIFVLIPLTSQHYTAGRPSDSAPPLPCAVRRSEGASAYWKWTEWNLLYCLSPPHLSPGKRMSWMPGVSCSVKWLKDRWSAACAKNPVGWNPLGHSPRRGERATALTVDIVDVKLIVIQLKGGLNSYYDGVLWGFNRNDLFQISSLFDYLTWHKYKHVSYQLF